MLKKVVNKIHYYYYVRKVKVCLHQMVGAAFMSVQSLIHL